MNQGELERRGGKRRLFRLVLRYQEWCVFLFGKERNQQVAVNYFFYSCMKLLHVFLFLIGRNKHETNMKHAQPCFPFCCCCCCCCCCWTLEWLSLQRQETRVQSTWHIVVLPDKAWPMSSSRLWGLLQMSHEKMGPWLFRVNYLGLI